MLNDKDTLNSHNCQICSTENTLLLSNDLEHTTRTFGTVYVSEVKPEHNFDYTHVCNL